jgi:hypothetical protein
MNGLITEWKLAAKDLGVEISAPAKIKLNNGSFFIAEVLVKNFGAPNGTLVSTDYKIFEPLKEELFALGYTHSSYGDADMKEPYERESYIEMLSEWGWTGDSKLKPAWIID